MLIGLYDGHLRNIKFEAKHGKLLFGLGHESQSKILIGSGRIQGTTKGLAFQPPFVALSVLSRTGDAYSYAEPPACHSPTLAYSVSNA